MGPVGHDLYLGPICSSYLEGPGSLRTFASDLAPFKGQDHPEAI